MVSKGVGNQVGKAAASAGLIGRNGCVIGGALTGGITSGAMTIGGNIIAGNNITDGLTASVLLGAAGGAVGGALSCGCFTEEMLIKTADGDKPIQDIQKGDEVWAFNESTGQTELRAVTATFSLMREATYTLYVGEQALETTSDHPFYNGDQWVKAGTLQPGDSVQMLEGGLSAIQAINLTAGYVQVYNFEVEGLHNYYVGKDGVLVHNPNCEFSSEMEESYNAMSEDEKIYADRLVEKIKDDPNTGRNHHILNRDSDLIGAHSVDYVPNEGGYRGPWRMIYDVDGDGNVKVRDVINLHGGSRERYIDADRSVRRRPAPPPRPRRGYQGGGYQGIRRGNRGGRNRYTPF